MDKDMERQKAQLALGGCLSLLAAVTGQPEKQLTPWLDLYYEVRHRYEIAAGREEDPQLLRVEDAYPIIQQMLRDVMRSEGAEKARSRKKANPSTADAVLLPLGKGGKEPEGGEGFEIGQMPMLSGASGWVKYKRRILERLAMAREAGATFARIAEASHGMLTDQRVMDAINAQKLSREEWRALEDALDEIGTPEE